MEMGVVLTLKKLICRVPIPIFFRIMGFLHQADIKLIFLNVSMYYSNL
ncbi:hypothetical protein LEP1GSC145_1715 [Leptospira interrogans serovar Djasiman str. LT1649]|nr:hypothetical protein LEP1GSC145_1715 [Leptospira interrogans serovar Djasiman str. LT1649]